MREGWRLLAASAVSRDEDDFTAVGRTTLRHPFTTFAGTTTNHLVSEWSDVEESFIASDNEDAGPKESRPIRRRDNTAG